MLHLWQCQHTGFGVRWAACDSWHGCLASHACTVGCSLHSRWAKFASPCMLRRMQSQCHNVSTTSWLLSRCQMRCANKTLFNTCLNTRLMTRACRLTHPPGNMRACVVAPISLDDLEQMVAASLGRLRAAPTPAHIPMASSQTFLFTPPGPTLPGPGPGVVLGVGSRPQAEPRLDMTWVLPHGE